MPKRLHRLRCGLTSGGKRDKSLHGIGGRVLRRDTCGEGGIVFLASPASSFTTGTNLVIDGALTRGVQL